MGDNKMIIYAAIAQKNEIFAECPENGFPILAEVCKQIVAQIPLDATGGRTYKEKRYSFHYKCEGERVYICATAKDTPMRIAYSFLNDVSVQLKYDVASPRKILKEKMDFHNKPENDKITNVKREIADVVVVMMGNIDKVLKRGEKLETLVAKSNEMVHEAEVFNKSSKSLKRKFLKKYWKKIAIIAGIVLIVIIVTVAVACL